MKVGIVGGREFVDEEYMTETILTFAMSGNFIDRFVSGGAYSGADKIAETVADKMVIPIDIYPAEWARLGRSAGFQRNLIIIKNSDVIMAFWNGASKGTFDTIRKAKEYKVPLIICFYNSKDITAYNLGGINIEKLGASYEI